MAMFLISCTPSLEPILIVSLVCLHKRRLHYSKAEKCLQPVAWSVRVSSGKTYSNHIRPLQHLDISFKTLGN